jgi:transcriptional regulator with XRE-family HTH domain
MRNNEEIISLIKSYLDNSSMSMSELASKSGVSKSTLSRYLSGSRVFPLNKADDFAKALGMTTEQFLNVKPSSHNDNQSAHDIDNIIENAMMFDGKPLTEDDKRAIRGIIAGYMNSKGE